MTKLDMDKIARRLGAERRGGVPSRGGYFGALQLAAEVQARFGVPHRGGRATDPQWTERRLVPLAPETLARLAELVKSLRKEHGIEIAPLQLAALLLEHDAAMAGVPAKTIQELACHTTLAVTMRYMHLSPSALDDGIEMLAKSREAGGTVVAGPGSKRGSA